MSLHERVGERGWNCPSWPEQAPLSHTNRTLLLLLLFLTSLVVNRLSCKVCADGFLARLALRNDGVGLRLEL